MVKIGYAKVGRVVDLRPARWGQVGGSNEPPVLLNKLARRNPDVEWVLLGRNDGASPADVGLPPNVINAWNVLRDDHRQQTKGKQTHDVAGLERVVQRLAEVWWEAVHDLDSIVLWAGQHGTSNAPIIKVDGSELTKPQESFVFYAGWLHRCVNFWRDANPWSREEVWLCPDVRNYVKGRDLKWPNVYPVLGQYDWTRTHKYYRYGDTTDPDVYNFDAKWDEQRTYWSHPHHYAYSGLEVSGIPSSLECSYDATGRAPFGIVINEARGYVTLDRKSIVRDWVLPLRPAWLRGKWSPSSQEELGVQVEPVAWHAQWDLLRTVRSTFTTPSSGSGWATTKPWEAFACGVACFFHPGYDDQGHVIPTLQHVREGRVDDDPTLKHLASWLRVTSPEQLERRVKILTEDDDAWHWLVSAQRSHFDRMMNEHMIERLIEQRLGLTTPS